MLGLETHPPAPACVPSGCSSLWPALVSHLALQPILALAGWLAQLVGRHPVHQKSGGSIPTQGT